MHYVYRIEVEGTTRYIGFTENIERRQKEHNYLCFKADKKKLLYDNIRKSRQRNITLNIIKTFRTRIEAKRYEAYLILADYFNKKDLWQKIPNISDR